MVKAKKNTCISNKILECGKDSKRLYKLFNNLTGSTKENPLPPRTDDKQLADEIVNYFIDKIKNIRAILDHNELYLPTSHDDVPKLT